MEHDNADRPRGPRFDAVVFTRDTADYQGYAQLRPGEKDRLIARAGRLLGEMPSVIECISIAFDTCARQLGYKSDDEAMDEAASAEARFPQSDWQYEVGNGYTRLGYSDWLAGRVADEDGERLNTRSQE